MVLLHQSGEIMQSIHPITTSGAFEGQKSYYPQRQHLTMNHHYPITSKVKKASKLLAAQKHRIAEQSRRNRISGQYATLRAILPNLPKTDKNKLKKAFILAETIHRVKELKKIVYSVQRAANREVIECGLPCGRDKLSLEQCEGGEGMVKVELSCEDRQEIVAEVARALKSVKVKLVRAEMVTVGGRNKFVLWVQGIKEGTGMLKRALENVMRKSSWLIRKPRK